MYADLIRGTKENQSQSERTISYAYQTRRITTRETPCGEGSETWDLLQRIYEPLWLTALSEIVKQITSISVEPGGVQVADA